MASNQMIDKLKEKIEEIDIKRIKTQNDQMNLLETITKFNEKIRNYIECDTLQKNSYKEGVNKIQSINLRIQKCNFDMSKIREKLKFINSKMENNPKFKSK